MKNVIIWHNPRCRKSREGLKFLQDKGIEPEIFEYLKEPIDSEHLGKIIKNSGQPLALFIREKEEEYKQLGLKNKSLEVDEFAEIAAQHPKILERPIVEIGDRSVLGRPAAEIEKILS